jgi:hypothetical protein
MIQAGDAKRIAFELEPPSDTTSRSAPAPATAAQGLHDLLVIAITSLLYGAEHFTDMADFGRGKDDGFKNYLRLASA